MHLGFRAGLRHDSDFRRRPPWENEASEARPAGRKAKEMAELARWSLWVLALAVGHSLSFAETIPATPLNTSSDKWTMWGADFRGEYSTGHIPILEHVFLDDPYVDKDITKVAKEWCGTFKKWPEINIGGPVSLGGFNASCPALSNDPVNDDVHRTNNPSATAFSACWTYCGPPNTPWTIAAWSVLTTDYSCPANQNWKLKGTTCYRPDCKDELVRDLATGKCVPAPGTKDPNPPTCGLKDGNPVNAGTGAKYQYQEVFSPSSSFGYGLSFSSRVGAGAPLFAHGVGWMSPAERRLLLSVDDDDNPLPALVIARRPSGTLLLFRRQISSNYVPDSDVNDQLIRVPDAQGTTANWIYLDASSNVVETYPPASE